MHEVVVFGASGYSGLELLTRLNRMARYKVVLASSNRLAGTPIRSAVLEFSSDLNFIRHDSALERIKPGQFALLATPAKTSAELVPKLLARSLNVVDLSGAFRLKNAADYPEWYGFEHPAPELLASARYGLPELFSPKGPLIANPGCYATAALLCSAPLLKAGLIEGPIMFDGKSGTTGAGQTPALPLMHAEVSQNLRPYKVGHHQHTPEIEQALGDYTGQAARACLTTHLIPMRRGILVSAYAHAKPGTTQAAIDQTLDQAFEGTEVHVSQEAPQTARVCGTNHTLVHAKLEPRTGAVLSFAAIDNLVKGAAGQALQNLVLLAEGTP